MTCIELGAEIRQFETAFEGLDTATEPDRALATILFTDIVRSTERLSAMGDQKWRFVLDRHDTLARIAVDQHRGRLVHASGATGDGILATFDRPSRAIRCVGTLEESLRPLDISIRAGLHTGEVELRESGVAGIGVHIAARVLSEASPGEILVSAAIPMLVAGSTAFEFANRGDHELRGIPGAWKLFAVTAFSTANHTVRDQ